MNLFELAGNININTSGAISALNAVQNAANNTSVVFSRIGNVVQNSGNSFSGLQAGIGIANQAVMDIGSTITNVGQGIINFGNGINNYVSKPLQDFTMKGINFNSQIEDLTMSFSVMLGSEKEAIDMTNTLKKMGADTPFEITGLAESTKTLLQFGINQKKVIPLMSKIGDVAMGNENNLKGLSFVMGQINSLGRLQAGDLNQLINRGWNPLNQISERTGKTMKETRKRMSEGKISFKEVEQALVDVTSKGGLFYKGMEKGSQTLSGRLSTLRDNFNNLLGQATKPLFEFIAKKAIPFLTILTEKFTKLGPNAKTAITVFGALGIAIGPVVIAIGTIITAIGAFISSFGLIAPLVPTVILPFTAFGTILGYIFVKTNILKTVINFLKNSFMFLASVIKGDFSLSLKTLVKNFGISEVAAKKFINPFKSIRSVIMDAIKNFENFVNILGEIFKGDWNSATNKIIKFFKVPKPVAKALIDQVKDFIPVIKDIGKSLLKISTKSLKAMANFIEEAAKVAWKNRGKIVFFIGLLLNLSEGALKAVSKISKFASNFDKTMNSLKKDVARSSGFILGSIYSLSQIPGLFKKYFVKAGLFVAISLSDMYNNATKWFSNIFSSVSNNVSKIYSSITSWFSKIPGRVSSFLSQIPVIVVNYLFNAALAAYTWGSNIINNLVSGIRAGIGKVGSAIASVAGVIADHMPHSPAKVGPLKSADKFAPGFMKMLISGFKNSLPGLKTTISLVADTIREQFYNATTEVNGYFDKLRESVQESLRSQKETAVEEVDKMSEIIGEALSRANPRIKENIKENEIKRLLKSKNKDELKDLLKTYYPDWQDAGRSLGDILVNGLNSKKTSMSKALTSFFGTFNDAVKSTETKTMKWLNKLEKQYEAGIKKMKKSTGKIEDYEELIEKSKNKIEKGKLSKKEKKKNAEIKEDIEHYKKHLENLEKYNKKLAKKFNMKYKGGEFFFPDGTQAFAKGVKNFKGGWAMVGEEGAELVHLPYGSSVIPNNKINSVSKNELGIDSNNIIININNAKFFNESDIDKMMKPVVQKLQRNINIKRTR